MAVITPTVGPLRQASAVDLIAAVKEAELLLDRLSDASFESSMLIAHLWLTMRRAMKSTDRCSSFGARRAGRPYG
jgi:hypothetical protein